ncbi:uncharacterized protein LOC114232160 [Eptesicus fuscus]|uniref:uncharacterized protein LOC114232160 n=1 Tax=Eptesicus fuscus TaxID=29078 RepID=UPI002403B98B|nr:uncharacterized protein LOC114232160 [Eptesicus fuscus]
MAGRTSQESFEDEPRDSSSQNFLEEEDSGPPPQQLQATSSTGSESISNSGPSHGPLVNLEYLPFFRTYEQLLTEELALQPEVGSDQGGAESPREVPSWEDSEPPGGLFPYYRSKEENFPRLSYRASQDPPTRREAQAGCFHRTVISGSSAASAGLDLVSGSSPICCTILLVSAGHSHDNSLDNTLSSGHTLRDSGFVPYYRTPEEKLHTSPGPAASLRAAKRSQGRSPGLEQPHRKDPKPAAARVGPPAPADQ